MRTDELDYELPDAAIAQTPAEPRDAARLLVDRGADLEPADARVADLPDLLQRGDLVVVNDTRVLPARVQVTRAGGGAGEVLLLEETGDGWWRALCRPSRKMHPGEVVRSAIEGLAFELGEAEAGTRLVRPLHDGPLTEVLEQVGTMPLPPYITRRLTDADRYQTVYADRPASAAAPTAGLHLTPAVLERVAQVGAQLARVELVVGLDTFRPIASERVEDHDIHSERYRVPPATVELLRSTRESGGRVVAVGTTSVRALETYAATGEAEGRTSLFITPGHEFALVEVLLTNFHLPRSSLLAMIQAFVGPRWRDLYAEALRRDYRFLSFGDAMLLERAGPTGGSAS
jgi:S-adenosylmethionine:tRNA ribosyltransferase-isomerase